jgi:putative salt-induced outer membrane protein YdiY
MIFRTYNTHAQALLALMDMRYNAGHCEQCGLWARLKVCDAPPVGDQEQYHIGTECHSCGIEEER